MNIMELQKSISEKNFRNLYIFTGEEYAILEIYIKRICDATGYPVKKSDSVYSVYKTLSSKSLLGSDKQIFVIREDKDFTTNESIWKDIVSRLRNRGTIIIAKYSNIDARSKFSKQFADYITTFDSLSESVLGKYVSKEVDLDDKRKLMLIDICKGDYGRILLETNKIKNYSQATGIDHKESFDRFLKDHGFYIEPDGEVFELVDSIMNRSIKNIYNLLEESKRRDDNPLLVLSLMHTNAKNVLQIQIAGSDGDVSKQTGLTGFQVKNAYKYVNKYSCEELVRMIRYIKYCEKSVKNGMIPQEMVIDYLLVNVL